jgi:hypothetical protein
MLLRPVVHQREALHDDNPETLRLFVPQNALGDERPQPFAFQVLAPVEELFDLLAHG